MPAFEPILFLLAVLTSAACMVFLFRGYSRTGARLLFWSGLCFVFLTINNVLLFFDLVVYPTSLDLRSVDLHILSLLHAIGICLFVFLGA